MYRRVDLTSGCRPRSVIPVRQTPRQPGPSICTQTSNEDTHVYDHPCQPQVKGCLDPGTSPINKGLQFAQGKLALNM